MTRLARIPVLLALAFLLTSAGDSAERKNRFDGYWGIDVFGAPGRCAFRYSTAVRVRDGQVSWRGYKFPRAGISISATGTVIIRLTDGKNWVTGSGALRLGSGKGDWAAPTFRCTGGWEVYRN